MAMNPRLLRPLSRATRILYFNGAVDGEWTELGNWWADDTFTTPAASLPTSRDSVIASAAISTNSGSEPTVANFTLSDPNGDFVYLGIAITVTGNATFNDNSYNDSTVTGDATFNDGSSNFGTVNGNATFNGNSSNSFVNGNATFNDTSSNSGTVTGDATFNDDSSNDIGNFVNGNATFNDTSVNYATVTGTATFTGSACNDGGTAGAFVPDPPPSCAPAGLSLWQAETREPVYHWSM